MTDIEPRTETSLRLFDGGPAQVVAQASELATGLATIIKDRGLYTDIKGKRYVQVEGWTLLGTMLGVVPICLSCDLIEDSKGQPGYKAHVEVRTVDGRLVGAAFGFCSRSESTWSSREDYALAGMAETRATSRAMRKPLGFIMKLAGYESTAFEEMPSDEPAGTQTVVRREMGDVEAEAYSDHGPIGSGPPTSSASPSGFVSDSQRKRMWALAKAAGFTEEAFKALVKARCRNVASTNDIYSREAVDLIRELEDGVLTPGAAQVPA